MNRKGDFSLYMNGKFIGHYKYLKCLLKKKDFLFHLDPDACFILQVDFSNVKHCYFI